VLARGSVCGGPMQSLQRMQRTSETPPPIALQKSEIIVLTLIFTAEELSSHF